MLNGLRHNEVALLAHIIAMRLKFNRYNPLFIVFCGLLSSGVSAQAVPLAVPLVVPESIFKTLGRITGDTLNQRLMDQHSIVRVQLADPQAQIAPETPLVVFRQGIRLKAPGGETLGVLAIPVARARTLSRQTAALEIAHPDQPGVAWMHIQSLQQEVMRGDSVMAQEAAKQLESPPCTPPADSPAKAAQVLALVSQADMLSANGDLVAISGGCANGMTPGATVTLWRPATKTYGRKLDQPVEDRRNNATSVFEDNPAIAPNQTPTHRVGTGTVLASYPDTAIVRIQNISQAVQPGDLVRLLTTKTRP